MRPLGKSEPLRRRTGDRTGRVRGFIPYRNKRQYRIISAVSTEIENQGRPIEFKQVHQPHHIVFARELDLRKSRLGMGVCSAKPDSTLHHSHWHPHNFSPWGVLATVLGKSKGNEHLSNGLFARVSDEYQIKRKGFKK
jgi:hypothetical protein